MKKLKYLLIFVFVIILFTGCTVKKKEDDTPKDDPKPVEVDETLFVINDLEFHFDTEKDFNGIKYTISKDLKEANHDQYIQYYLYQDSGPNLLFFRIFYYENKTHNDIRNDLGIDSSFTEEKGKTDNVEYSFIDEKRTDGTIHYYIIDKDNKSYLINFVSKYDIKDFEAKAMKYIKF